MPVAMAVPSKEHNVFNVSNTGIVVSNPVRSIDMCPPFSV
jgi:hypothetical protein